MNKGNNKEDKDNLSSVKTETQFKNFFEVAADAMFIAEADTGIIVEANQAASRLLLLPHDSIVGLHQSKLHPPLNKESVNNVFEIHKLEANEKAMTHPLENTIIRSDGTEVPVEILASKIYYKGKSCLMGTFRDITERKKAEEAIIESKEQFKNLSEEVPAFISSFLPDGTVCNLFEPFFVFSLFLINTIYFCNVT